MVKRTITSMLLFVVLLAGCANNSDDNSSAVGIDKIDHLVVIYLENHSFDNIYGSFPGAEGLTEGMASPAATQVDANGMPLASLTMPTATDPTTMKPIFPATLPNKPFDMTKYVALTADPPDLVHRYYQEIAQIDGGKMDKFALVSDVKGESMGYFPTSGLPLEAVAKQYTMCDHFFHGAFGGSFMNHIYLISAQVAVFPNAPPAVVAVLDANGNLVTDGFVTPDGHAVNTCYSFNNPHPAATAAKTPEQLVPNQTFTTIGDELSTAAVSWAWYSGGWTDAINGSPSPLFQFHHQPFVYFKSFADGTQAKTDHLKDETDFIGALSRDDLPAVSFVKPIGDNNEHPGYTSIAQGEQHVVTLLQAIQASKHWKSTAVVITYDEHGGFWDHVAPPVGDVWGPGSRVPAIIVSPWAKKGFVDKTEYETASILAFIEKRWNVPPMATRDAKAANLTNAFDFTQTVN